ncbi:MAG: STAS domain-containing protein, partial [Alphaproteobacteria bacterium]|nr:STAS domain-containing protein [Alphaproteobacteria bacterium]
MEIKEIRKESIMILEVVGRLDASTSPALEQKFLSLLEKGNNDLVVDFSQLQYISSAGLRILLLAAKRTSASGGRLALCALTDSIREVFEISG